MNIFRYFIVASFFLIMFSCTTTSELGVKIDQMLQSKRYKETLRSRDSLFRENLTLKNDTMKLGTDVRLLQGLIKKINNEYTAVRNEHIFLKEEHKIYSDSMERRIAQLDEELKTVTEALKSKEQQLEERADKLQTVEVIISKQDSLIAALDKNVTNLLMDFNPEELMVAERNGGICISVNEKLLFKPGSVVLLDKGKQALKILGEVLAKNNGVHASILGHTDNIALKSSFYKDNWELSLARASALVRIFNKEYNINPGRLSASGIGEFSPVASNEDPEGRARNRRMEIILTPGNY